MEYIWKQLAIIIMFAVVVNLCFAFCLFLFLNVMQQREKSWFASSLRSRMQYLDPDLGLPSIYEELPKNISLDPSVGPVGTFCLLVLDPEKALPSC